MIVPFNADFNGQAEKPWIKNEFLADKAVLEYVLFKAVNQEPFQQFMVPKVVEEMLTEYKEDNDYLLSFVKHVYIENGWHELEVVPVFFATEKLQEFAKDHGIQKPNTWGAGKDIAKNLRNLTKNNYVLKKGRTKEQDLDILEPDGFEYKRAKLKRTQHSIIKV